MGYEKEEAVLIINSSFYPSTGGVESTLRGMAKDLSHNNDKVVVVSGDRTNLSDEREASEEILFGAKVYRYRTIGAFLYFFTCTYLLLKLKRKYEFTTVISRSIPTTLCCILAGFNQVKYIAPAVYRYQNNPKLISSKGIKKYISYSINSILENICLRLLPEVYVFSDEMVKQVSSVSPKLSIKKVFPGVDVTRFNPALPDEVEILRKKKGLPLNKKILLFIGRVEMVKNPTHMIDVLEHLSDDFISVVVGEGGYKEHLISHTEEKGLQGRVYFFPFTKAPEEFYKLSDAFLMVSVYEPFGQVILESFATKLPVFGYKNDVEINTATEEIFDFLVISKEKYICEYKYGTKRLASLINLSIDERKDFECLNVPSWHQFFKNISSASSK